MLCLLLLSACRSRDTLLTQAQAAWDRGDFQAAATRYEEFLKDAPASEQAANVHFEAAKIYYLNLKQYDRAAEHYIRLVDDYPQFDKREQVYHHLAECLELMKKPREAISEYERLLIAFPGTPERRKIRLAIADLYYGYDQSQALVEYQKVVKDAAYDELSEKAYLRIGGVRFLRNEFQDAIPAYETIDQHTKDPLIRRQARDRLADCHENLANYDVAIKILEQTEPDPKEPDYLTKRIAGIRERQKTRRLMQPGPTPEQKK
ncbi:MAG TPA: tetratricopeptide repeat protein [Blastocatellia bacterium]|nr:tetratricopeptide repeat protein [Blastocatellia bacterium]